MIKFKTKLSINLIIIVIASAAVVGAAAVASSFLSFLPIFFLCVCFVF